MSGHVVAENVAKMISLARYKKKKREAQLSILIIPSRENLFCGRQITEHFIFIPKKRNNPRKVHKRSDCAACFPLASPESDQTTRREDEEAELIPASPTLCH